jgi:hypothetical protein
MRGKVVNISIGLLNILLGIVIGVFTFIVPQDITLITVQENQVRTYILIAIYAVMGVLILFNLIEYFIHRKDGEVRNDYIFSLFMLSFIFIKEPLIAILPIVSGIFIISKTIRENLVEVNSMFAISIAILLATAMAISMVCSVFYSQIGTYIKDKENEDEQAYKSDYFKYVTELNEAPYNEPYINIKKDGKYGYITTSGQEVIGFEYDYASPFIQINVYDKKFEIALVCKDGQSIVILKNGRKVLTYRSESADENYNAKIQELQDLYNNTFKQEGTMQYEINKITNNISKVPVYAEDSEKDYTYRYDYNVEYDLIVTKSNMGLSDKYELAKKDNLNVRITLDCNAISYDENFAYIFSNGTIPFYDLNKREQGWFTGYGKKVTMSGKAQILDFFDDKILIRNYNDHTIYFIDSKGNILSEIYKEIYVLTDRYIVKGENNKYKIIGKDFQKIFENEYDYIDPYLVNYGLYIVGNTSDGVEFNKFNYAKMNLSLINSNGETIMENIEQIYGNFYKISNEKNKSYATRYTEFLENVKSIEYNFVGDNFYKEYYN